MDRHSVLLAPVCIAAAAACSGGGSGGAPPALAPDPDGQPAGGKPGGPLGGAGATGTSGMAPVCGPGAARFPTPIRRLTRTEYDNTVRDLLGDTTRPARGFPADEVAGGFGNNAAVQTVSPLLAEKYMQAAESLAAVAVREPARLVPCAAAAAQGGPAAEDACAKTFVETFGRRAFRRPLAPAEVARLVKVYQAGRAGATFVRGLEVTLRAVLQAPSFLYRIEVGQPLAAGETLARLTPHEVASRLSYLLWASTPDEALLRAADSGELGTAAGVARTARAMLGDPRARAAIADFYRQWLGLAALDHLAKDAAAYPEWNEELRVAMQAELPAFVEHVMGGGAGAPPATLTSLLTAPVSIVTPPLARLYGVTAVAGKPVALDAAERAGLLTQPGLLAVAASPNQSSPVLRGKLVREQVLCQTMPEAPPDLMASPPEVDARTATRERFAQHTKDPSCAGCHRLMDPLGHGFEAFDAIGRHRAKDGGRDVDTSGTVVGTDDLDGDFRGAPALAAKLAGSAQVASCVVTQWYRYALGRLETPGDACALAGVKAAFSASRLDLGELLVALTQTDPFLRRVPLAEETP